MVKVDNSFLWDNCFFLETESGIKYCVNLEETDNGSGAWVVNFILVQGVPNNREVFKTLSALWQNLKSFMLQKNIVSAFGWIDGKDRQERDQKTRVFARWVDSPFVCEIDFCPEVRVQGKNDIIYPDTNFFHIKRVGNVSVQTSNNDSSGKELFRFCPNCGTKNEQFKFCSNCGTSLQQN